MWWWVCGPAPAAPGSPCRRRLLSTTLTQCGGLGGGEQQGEDKSLFGGAFQLQSRRDAAGMASSPLALMLAGEEQGDQEYCGERGSCNTQATRGPELVPVIDKHTAASLPPLPVCTQGSTRQRVGGFVGGACCHQARCASIFIRGESLGSSRMLSVPGKLSGPAAPFLASHRKEEILECQLKQWYLDV